VHIITTPVPNLGSTSSSEIILTCLLNNGISTDFPIMLKYLSSFGFTATATQAERSSGLVVAIKRSFLTSLSINLNLI